MKKIILAVMLLMSPIIASAGQIHSKEQVKIFFTFDNFGTDSAKAMSDLESQMNLWLNDMQGKIEITRVCQSSAGAGNNYRRFEYLIMIFYKSK